MNKILILLSLFSIFNSCATKHNLEGTYNSKISSNGFDKEYTLQLEKKTFKLNFYTKDASPECFGEFRVIKDSLFLKCYEENSLISTINSGYMNIRNYRLKIIDNQKLMMIEENLVLSKK
ncbi:hypothetical protein [Chryseobacterium indoltheticum]|uniref:hypothetical protein n=1 Tax=Chryseobacterium indoltheticum TaxID=254 RepID=UPI004042895E